MNTAIHSDAALDFDGSDDAADEFLRRLTSKDAPEPSKEDEGKNTEDDTNEDAEDGTEDSEGEGTDEEQASDGESDERGDDDAEASEGEEDEGSEDARKQYVESDDAVVKIKVDGQEVEASIKDLKRLYGQEAALTRKSQEAADTRKKAEEAGAMHVAGLETMLERARKQYEPYANLNFLALTKDPNISQEELSALSEAATAAFENVRFLETELGGVIKYHEKQRHEALVAQAREANKVLSDPEKGIQGWGEPLYNEIRTFAIEQGMDQKFVNEVVDPVGIKILHMAMQYAKGKKAVTDNGKGPKKVDKSPKRIMKGAATETVQKAKVIKKDAAYKQLQRSGSTDDAAEAFLARWSNE